MQWQCVSVLTFLQALVHYKETSTAFKHKYIYTQENVSATNCLFFFPFAHLSSSSRTDGSDLVVVFCQTTVLPPRCGSLPCRQRYIPSESGCGLKGRRGTIKVHVGICRENELHRSSDIIGVAVRRQCQLAHWRKEP